MKSLVWIVKWLLRAAIFFTLFAFALNNPNLVQLNFFFGHHWQAPLVLVVLMVFALGVAVGALGMTPRWWRSRKNRSHAMHSPNQMPMPFPSSSSPSAANPMVIAGTMSGSARATSEPVSRPHGA